MLGGEPKEKSRPGFDACHSHFLWAAVALLADWVSGQRFGFTEPLEDFGCNNQSSYRRLRKRGRSGENVQGLASASQVFCRSLLSIHTLPRRLFREDIPEETQEKTRRESFRISVVTLFRESCYIRSHHVASEAQTLPRSRVPQ